MICRGGERAQHLELRDQRRCKPRGDRVECRIVASILNTRAGVPNGGAIPTELTGAVRKAGAHRNMVEVNRELTRLCDGRTLSARRSKQ